MRLLGNIEAKTDAKGRAFLPVAFRKVLQADDGDGMVLRKDVYQRCLTLYPMSSWNELMDSVRNRINRWNPRHLQLYRQFLSDVEIVYPDSNGRILIPRRLTEAAGIGQNIRFIGMGDYIEIWDSRIAGQPFVSHDDFTREMEALMAMPTSNCDSQEDLP
jgi:MraZ protein